MTGELREATRLRQDIPSSGVKAPFQETPGGGTVKTTTRPSQEAVSNSAPITQIQFGSIFKIQIVMDMAEEMVVEAVLHTDEGCPFCMSCHLKGVCKSNYGGRHMHRHLSSIYHVLLSDCKSQLCGISPYQSWRRMQDRSEDIQ